MLALSVIASVIVIASASRGNDTVLPPPAESPASLTAKVTAYSSSADETWGDPFESPTSFTAEVTAYSSSPDETWGDPLVTASGRTVQDGIVACPRRFPFGTKFRIGSRVYACWDRLDTRFDHRFDIWKPSKEEALRFGRRVLVVEML
jgi:3D (Asp-Asp-Asp) domain-containing protein